MMHFMKRLARGFRREDGTASIEFVMALPVMLTIFMASFESGLLMTRSIMLEQSVDITMRELRLGHYNLPDAALIKREICKRTVIMKDCEASTIVELTRVSTTNWVLPNSQTSCVNKDEEIQIADTFVAQQQNDMMLVRVCVRQELIFPKAAIGVKLASDNQGGYSLVAISAFVVEPN